MKKQKLLIGIIISSMILYQHTICSAFATEKDNAAGITVQGKEQQPFNSYMENYPERVTDLEEWKMVDGEYQYPLTREDDEWLDIASADEKYAACQIPEKIINELDTAALLQLVLECPMLYTIGYYDSYYDGIKFFAQNFNGMYALINRSDFYETVVDYYQKMLIPLNKKNNLEEILPNNPTDKDFYAAAEDKAQMKKVNEDIKIERIICFCETVIAGMTEHVKSEVLEQAGEVLSMKYREISVSEYKDAVLSKEELQEAAWADKKVTGEVNSIFNAPNKASASQLKTRGGLLVDFTELKNRRPLTYEEQQGFISNYLKFKKPGTDEPIVETIGGTTGYNCHNYAWLYCDDKYRDAFWKQGEIKNIDNYKKDKSYGQTSTAKGRFQVGSSSQHSVLVTNTSVSYMNGDMLFTDVMVKSKWGLLGPLVRHPLSLAPYPSGYTFYC